MERFKTSKHFLNAHTLVYLMYYFILSSKQLAEVHKTSYVLDPSW